MKATVVYPPPPPPPVVIVEMSQEDAETLALLTSLNITIPNAVKVQLYEPKDGGKAVLDRLHKALWAAGVRP